MTRRTMRTHDNNMLDIRTHYAVDKVLNDIRRDLKQSGLYFKYMEENGPDEYVKHNNYLWQLKLMRIIFNVGCCHTPSRSN